MTMMSLDSWIDADDVALMRALCPPQRAAKAASATDEAGDDWGLAAIGVQPRAADEPVAVPEVSPAAVLAEVKPEPAGATFADVDADASASAAPAGARVPAPRDTLQTPRIERSSEPGPEALAKFRDALAAIRQRAEREGAVRSMARATVAATAVPRHEVAAVVVTAGAVPVAEPVPAAAAKEEAAEEAAALEFADESLARRLSRLRSWLGRLGLQSPQVLDRHGNALHLDGRDPQLAAAVMAAAKAAQRAALSGGRLSWQGRLAVAVPVPTRFGMLVVGGVADRAVTDDEASDIACTTRRCVRVEA